MVSIRSGAVPGLARVRVGLGPELIVLTLTSEEPLLAPWDHNPRTPARLLKRAPANNPGFASGVVLPALDEPLPNSPNPAPPSNLVGEGGEWPGRKASLESMLGARLKGPISGRVCSQVRRLNKVC